MTRRARCLVSLCWLTLLSSASIVSGQVTAGTAHEEVDASLASPAWPATVQPSASQIRLRVRIVSGTQLIRDQLNLVCHEVARIWAPYGVQFDWRNGDGVPQRVDPGHVVVMLREGPITQGRGQPVAKEALASLLRTRWSYSLLAPSETPDAVILVSVSRARQLAEEAFSTEKSVDARSAMVSAVLPVLVGRAVGHEIGHYLLETADHSRHGLMRAFYKPRDVTAGLQSFTVDRTQLAQLRTLWARRADAPTLAAAR